jgi:hypothetical protein
VVIGVTHGSVTVVGRPSALDGIDVGIVLLRLAQPLSFRLACPVVDVFVAVGCPGGVVVVSPARSVR